MNHGRMALLALGALVVAAAGGAQTAPTPALLPRDVELRFETADLDNSGGLSRDEAVKGGFSSERFEAIDRDGDHIVTVYEMGVYLAERARDWADADRDHDGTITREEAEASPKVKAVFGDADRDSDGIVRQQEYEAWSRTSLYQNVDLPVVVPNIIKKKF